MRKKILLILLFLLLAAVAAIVIISISNRNRRRENLEAALTTETAQITRQTLARSVSATGTVESAKTKTVNTKMTNMKVLTVYVKEGDYVEEGSVICEFDSSDYKEALAEAQNNYSVNQQIASLGDDYTTVYNDTIAQAEDGLETVREVRDEAKDAYNSAREAYESKKAALSQAEKNYDPKGSDYDTCKAAYEAAKTALDQAAANNDPEKDTEEYRQLEEACTAAQTAFEDIQTKKAAYDKANAEFQEASALREQTKSSYEQAQAKREEYQEQYESTIKKAQYDYDKAVLEEQLISESQEEKTIDEYTELIEDCVIKADMSGVITSLNVTEGNNFEGGDIYSIQDNEHFIVSASVDEYDIASIEKGMTAYIKTDATGDAEMTGEVSYVAIAPESTGGAMGAVSSSASYRIEVTIDNPAENLRAGMTGKISIALEESKDALTVPYDAVTTGQDGNSLITVDVDGEKKQLSVQTGLETDYYTEIISDEIYEGMTVYLSNPLTVSSPENEEEIRFQGGMRNDDWTPHDGRGGNGIPSGGRPGGF